MLRAVSQNTRCIIHRTTLKTCERQHYRVIGNAAAECFVLRATGTLVTHEVRPCTADTCGTCRLMGIDHDVVLRSRLYDMLIMIVAELTVMILATRDDVTHITRLHGIVAILIHQVESVLQMPLIVQDGSRSLMMHHQLHTLRVGIVVEHPDIEVGIRGNEVEDIELLVTEPVFPTFIPAFHQHLMQTVPGGEVDVPFHLLVGSTVNAVGLALAIIGDTQTHRRIIIGVGPNSWSPLSCSTTHRSTWWDESMMYRLSCTAR